MFSQATVKKLVLASDASSIKTNFADEYDLDKMQKELEAPKDSLNPPSPPAPSPNTRKKYVPKLFSAGAPEVKRQRSLSAKTKLTESNALLFQEANVKITPRGISRQNHQENYRKSQKLLKSRASLSSACNNVQLEDLENVKPLGSGATGEVTLVKHKVTNKMYAKKIIFLDKEKTMKNIESEVDAIIQFMQTQNPHIVSYDGVFFKDHCLYIIMEYMDKGSLTTYIKQKGKLTEREIARVGESILQGLMYIHEEKQMAHRDLKPDNILMNTQKDIKISDFGCSRKGPTSSDPMGRYNSMFTTFIGTRHYMSPERLQAPAVHGRSSDIWSVGILLLEAFVGIGNTLFQKKAYGSEILEYLEFLKDPSQYDLPKEMSADLRDMITLCLNPDKSKRPSAKALLDHQFLRRYAGISPRFQMPPSPSTSPMFVNEDNMFREVREVASVADLKNSLSFIKTVEEEEDDDDDDDEGYDEEVVTHVDEEDDTSPVVSIDFSASIFNFPKRTDTLAQQTPLISEAQK